MKKKVLSLFMVLIMCAGLLAGCGGSGGSGSGSGSTSAADDKNAQTSADSGQTEAKDGTAAPAADDGETVELKMVMISMGLNLEDAGKVQDAINAYIQPKINATVSIEWLDMGDFANQLNLKLTSGETIDVLPVFGTFLSSLYAQEALSPMSELIANYGQGIVSAVGEDYMQAGYINGELYAIPTIQSFAAGFSLMYRVDIAEKYNLDFSNVKSLEDLTPIFETLHEKEPGMAMLVSNNPSDPMLTAYNWDVLVDEYGVLLDASNSLTVENLFESDEYKNLVTLMHEWYESGYIQTDAATTSDNMATLLKAGNSFGVIGSAYPGVVEQESMNCGYELAEVKLTDALSSTSRVNNSIIAIPTTSAHPEKAMEFINLLYTDAELLNMLYYGIEGEHYQVVDAQQGKVGYVDGQDMMSCKYVNKLKIGNQLLTYIDATSPDSLNENIEAYNASAKKSKALGFTYDSSSVANELAALDTVSAKYRRGLECGSLNPETELPKFIEELKNAGIDDVIAEKQAQLDAWVKANNIQ